MSLCSALLSKFIMEFMSSASLKFSQILHGRNPHALVQERCSLWHTQQALISRQQCQQIRMHASRANRNHSVRQVTAWLAHTLSPGPCNSFIPPDDIVILLVRLPIVPVCVVIPRQDAA